MKQEWVQKKTQPIPSTSTATSNPLKRKKTHNDEEPPQKKSANKNSIEYTHSGGDSDSDNDGGDNSNSTETNDGHAQAHVVIDSVSEEDTSAQKPQRKRKTNNDENDRGGPPPKVVCKLPPTWKNSPLSERAQEYFKYVPRPPKTTKYQNCVFCKVRKMMPNLFIFKVDCIAAFACNLCLDKCLEDGITIETIVEKFSPKNGKYLQPPLLFDVKKKNIEGDNFDIEYAPVSEGRWIRRNNHNKLDKLAQC